MRIILYTGKGGVGKTSIAAATACAVARSGKKTIVVSTDAAHSLSDSFGIKLTGDPVNIGDNLWGMEIDVVKENEKNCSITMDYMQKILTFKAQETIETEEMMVFPGYEELLSLVRIKELYDSGEFDTIIVDCAPTGETMSLLKSPELMKWWMDKFYKKKKKAVKIAGPVVHAATKIPMPDESMFDEFEVLFNKLDELYKLFMDKDTVSIRIVTTPEKIVVKEAKRSLTYLHLFDYNVDAVIINKIFPERSLEGYFSRWGALQQESIKDIYEGFGKIPVFRMYLQDHELREMEQLTLAGDQIYGDTDPRKVLFKENIFSITSQDSYRIFSINMPFADKKDMTMVHTGSELIIGVKNEKRAFELPANLRSCEISKARYEDGRLNIYFEK
ncbi:MAG: ArsA family ATPase [Oscillospiraceae bacterium]|nr:ArsA family ATPase [Oscillospiraceae bacterium]